MTWPQINDLYADGNEIGGHTAFHADLGASDLDEARRQVCYDRNYLLGRGFPVTSFAYPFGAYNAAIQSMVRECGYNSARGTESFEGRARPPCAETIPPADAYATRVVGYGPDGLATLQEKVRSAELNGGGWVQILIHQVCTGCSVNGITAATLKAFLDWLQPRAANGTVVRDGAAGDRGSGPAGRARAAASARAERDQRPAERQPRAGHQQRRRSRLLHEDRLWEPYVHVGADDRCALGRVRTARHRQRVYRTGPLR